MSVIKEWKCGRHGGFEGTHAICPVMGCESENVEREFRTPVSVSQGKYKRFDAGLRKTADRMGIPDWKTAREGEAGFAGRANPLGTQVLWGNDVQKEMGVPFAQQMQAAAKPLTVEGKDPKKDPYLTMNNGMRATANELGITRAVRPMAEVTTHKADMAGAK